MSSRSGANSKSWGRRKKSLRISKPCPCGIYRLCLVCWNQSQEMYLEACGGMGLGVGGEIPGQTQQPPWPAPARDHKQWLFKTEIQGLPWWLSGKEPACQCRRQEFDPWSGKIPRATEQLSPCSTAIGPVPSCPGAQLLSPHAASTKT